MPPNLPYPRLFTGLLLIAGVGCADGSGDPASKSSDLVQSPLLDGSEHALVVDIGGGGLMPPGSECVPGSKTIVVDWQQQLVGGIRCSAGADGIFHREQAAASALPTLPSFIDQRIAPTVLVDIRNASRQVAASDKLACAEGAKASIVLDVQHADGSIAAYRDDHYACEAHPTIHDTATSLEPLMAQMRAVESQLTFHPPIYSGLPDDNGATVWEAAASYRIENAGAGEVPLGSECAPGAAVYSLDTVSKQLDWSDCAVVTPGDPRLRIVPHSAILTDAELTQFRAAAEAATTTSTPVCAAKAFVSIRRTPQDPTQYRETFVDESACHGAPGRTTKKIDGLLDVLKQLVSN